LRAEKTAEAAIPHKSEYRASGQMAVLITRVFNLGVGRRFMQQKDAWQNCYYGQNAMNDERHADTPAC
jgi:hypothetical protein